MSTGRESVQSVQETPVDEEVVSETTEAAPESSDSKPESAEESTRRAFEEISKTEEPQKEAATETTESEAAKVPSKLETVPKREEPAPKKQLKLEKQPEIDADALDPELQPPERLSPKAKLAFQNLPKGLKREIHKTIKDVEAGGTKVVQEARKEAEEVRHIREAVASFVGDWADRGFTVPQGIMQLARVQQKLTNPETKLSTFIAIGRDLGIAPEHIAEHLSGKSGAAPAPLTSHPEFTALQNETKQLRSEIEQRNLAQSVQPIVQEMNAVRHEVDPTSGKFRYPELHDESYLESLKTRVTELVGNGSGLSVGQALLQANTERKQALFGHSLPAQSTTTRIPASAPQNNRAQLAAVSVRGSRVASGITPGNDVSPPPEALKNPAATTRWVLEQQRRGNLI